jgi:hypothetical protein
MFCWYVHGVQDWCHNFGRKCYMVSQFREVILPDLYMRESHELPVLCHLPVYLSVYACNT